jgi:hypothetical protein
MKGMSKYGENAKNIARKIPGNIAPKTTEVNART